MTATDRALLERARDVLNGVEWSATAYDDAGSHHDGCPWCGGIDPDAAVVARLRGHKPDCKLDSILRDLSARLDGGEGARI